MPQQSKCSPMYVPEGVDLWQWLQVKVTRFMDRTALIEWPSGKSMSYRQIFADSKHVAGALWDMGVRKNDVVLIFSGNAIETPIMINALFCTGAIMTACNPSYKATEVRDHIIESGSKYVVSSQELLPTVREVLKECSQIQKVIVYGDQVEGFTSYEDLIRYDGPPAPKVEINAEEDTSCLYFSSGTTGKPKGVVHTHTTMIALCENYSHPDTTFFPVEGPEAVVMFLPLFHMYAAFIMLIMFAHGKTAILMKSFNFDAFMKLNVQHKCKVLFTVPPVATLMVKHPDAGNYDLSNVRDIVCGAAPLGEEVEAELIKKFQLKALKQAYGMTELISHCCHQTDRKLASVGILVSNTECKIVDLETDEEVGPGQVGEIWTRGPQMMKCYLNRPEATAETIDKDGWLHTGDIGHADEDGHYFINGRKKELIKYKAFQVAPATLEDLLFSHNAIQDVAVIGLPDEMAGELPLAFVVLKPNHNATEKEIQQFVAERVAPFKQLRGGVRFVNEIPKSPSGKILRRILTQSLKSNIQ